MDVCARDAVTAPKGVGKFHWFWGQKILWLASLSVVNTKQNLCKQKLLLFLTSKTQTLEEISIRCCYLTFERSRSCSNLLTTSKSTILEGFNLKNQYFAPRNRCPGSISRSWTLSRAVQPPPSTPHVPPESGVASWHPSWWWRAHNALKFLIKADSLYTSRMEVVRNNKQSAVKRERGRCRLGRCKKGEKISDECLKWLLSCNEIHTQSSTHVRDCAYRHASLCDL